MEGISASGEVVDFNVNSNIVRPQDTAALEREMGVQPIIEEEIVTSIEPIDT